MQYILKFTKFKQNHLFCILGVYKLQDRKKIELYATQRRNSVCLYSLALIVSSNCIRNTHTKYRA